MLELIADQGPPASSAGDWRNPAHYWRTLTDATAHLAAPVAVIDQAALRHNALDLLVRAGGVIAQAAADLGLSRQALYRRMDRFGIKHS